ncbi:TolC family protein [Candidatus Neomarinimicrobiota bacterium]
MRITILALLILPIAMFGQTPVPLSLSEGIQIALEKNPSLQISAMRVEDAVLSYREARSSLMPQVGGQTSTILDEKIRIIEMPNFMDPTQTMELELDFTYDYQADFSVTQPLFTGGKIRRGIQLAKTNLEVTEIDEFLARNDIALQVTQAYMGALVAQEFLDVAGEAYLIAKGFHEMTQDLFEEGMVSKLEYLQSEVQMSNLEPRVTQAENAVKLAHAGLKMLLGGDEIGEYQLTDELRYEPVQYSLDELHSEALANRHELQQLALRGQMGKYALSMARGDYLPMVALTGSYSTFGNDLANVDVWDNSYTVAVGLSFNLFNGLKRQAGVQKARVAIRQSEVGSRALEEGIKLEVERAYHTLMESEKSFISSNKTVSQAEEAARLARLQYREGTITSLQTNQIQANLANARANRAQALFNYTLAGVSIKKAVGRNLIEELGAIQ